MALNINADRRATALVDGQSLPWIASPESGVERRMLERDGDEVAVASSIVRYAPGSRFAAHTHELGEEFLVLSGTFSDESGDFAAGSYVRNPPGSRHAPFSAEGCIIFVKLRQMGGDESGSVRVTRQAREWQTTDAAGVERASLYSNGRTEVALLRFAPGATLAAHSSPGGEEWFVVDGSLELLATQTRHLGPWSWRRSADFGQPALRSPRGALLWVKAGHL